MNKNREELYYKWVQNKAKQSKRRRGKEENGIGKGVVFGMERVGCPPLLRWDFF